MVGPISGTPTGPEARAASAGRDTAIHWLQDRCQVSVGFANAEVGINVLMRISPPNAVVVVFYGSFRAKLAHSEGPGELRCTIKVSATQRRDRSPTDSRLRTM